MGRGAGGTGPAELLRRLSVGLLLIMAVSLTVWVALVHARIERAVREADVCDAPTAVPALANATAAAPLTWQGAWVPFWVFLGAAGLFWVMWLIEQIERRHSDADTSWSGDGKAARRERVADIVNALGVLVTAVLLAVAFGLLPGVINVYCVTPQENGQAAQAAIMALTPVFTMVYVWAGLLVLVLFYSVARMCWQSSLCAPRRLGTAVDSDEDEGGGRRAGARGDFGGLM